jgi:hypothetical protein
MKFKVWVACSVLCRIEDRPNVLLKDRWLFEEQSSAIEIAKRVYRPLAEHANVVQVVGIDELGI